MKWHSIAAESGKLPSCTTGGGHAGCCADAQYRMADGQMLFPEHHVWEEEFYRAGGRGQISVLLLSEQHRCRNVNVAGIPLPGISASLQHLNFGPEELCLVTQTAYMLL